MQSDLADKIRADFPILATEMGGKPLVYFDNGATTQKPQAVIDAIVHYYGHDNANIHRGLYELSQRATDAFEQARGKVAKFLNAAAPEECIFVRGTTEAVNLVASSWGKQNLHPGDEVIVTGLEHHSNIVPWQMACAAAKAELKVLYSNEDGELDPAAFEKLLSPSTKMVAIQHVSNALGTIHDVHHLTGMAKAAGATVLIDGAQWVGHQATDVQDIGCDFYTFSAHKLFGPTGIGILWGRREILESMPPYQGGGDMIETVSFEETTYAPLPNRFEAGTPDIAGAVGLGAAIDYVLAIGFDKIVPYEDALLAYATEKLEQVQGLRIIGRSAHKAAVISFVLESPSIAPMDIASALSGQGIAIRTGHHCCMPLMGQLNVSGTSRVSLAMYNTPSEIDYLAEVLHQLVASRQKAGAGQGQNVASEISFGKPASENVANAADELAEEFLEFNDRESKTELLMELGQQLPDNFSALKLISTQVPGCMSEVYLVGRPMPEETSRFEFSADSNAEIVRGLIAVLQHLFSGQSATEILDFDIEDFFRRIGLDQFVSTQRRSGLDGMIRRIRTLAQSIVERSAAE